VSTKCRLGNPPPGEVLARLQTSLNGSLARMKLERVDLFFLHNMIIADEDQARYDGTPRTLFVDRVILAFERLREEGRIGAWGITGSTTARHSFTPFGLPGRLMIRVRPLIPTTERLTMAMGVCLRVSMRMASAMPGTCLWTTARVASGVTSLLVRPVPPVVTIRSRPSSPSRS